MTGSAVKHWWERDTAPGFVLIAATLASFLLLNGPASDVVHHALEQQIAGLSVGVGEGAHPLNLHLIINDALMVIFFLYVGLELKRETVEGPFKNPREAALPLVGAIGGMAAPALIYVALNAHEPVFLRGWAIPAATDIAFAIGVLSLLGPRVPAGLRLFLLALAIINDLGAIAVIALFYSTHLLGWALGGAVATFVIMLMMNRGGVTALWLYWLLGLVVWGFMLVSGVHATIAGVLTAMTVPMRNANGGSPLIAAEHALKYCVQFAIMPALRARERWRRAARRRVGDATAHGRKRGCARSHRRQAPWHHARDLSRLPRLETTRARERAANAWRHHAPGIGFTMSLFIGNLAFGTGDLATPVRFGVLGGSFASAVLGLSVLWFATRGAQPAPSDLTREEELAEERGVFEHIDPPKHQIQTKR